MRDLRAVLTEKEHEYRRIWAEVVALRTAIKLCEEPETAKQETVKPTVEEEAKQLAADVTKEVVDKLSTPPARDPKVWP